MPISLPLIERLLKEYPGTVAGIKDSSGNWDNTKAMFDGFDGFDVFVGSEAFLLAGMRNGGAGCISATANINPAAIRTLYETWQANDADAQQAALISFRKTIAANPMIPALKASIAWARNDPGWARVRPPLMALQAGASDGLATQLEKLGFQMT